MDSASRRGVDKGNSNIFTTSLTRKASKLPCSGGLLGRVFGVQIPYSQGVWKPRVRKLK